MSVPFKLHVTGIAAAAGFVVTTIGALVGPVGFGTAALRIVIGSLLAALFGSVGYALLVRFLPELVEAAGSGNTDESGQAIDIVISDDDGGGSDTAGDRVVTRNSLTAGSVRSRALADDADVDADEMIDVVGGDAIGMADDRSMDLGDVNDAEMPDLDGFSGAFAAAPGDDDGGSGDAAVDAGVDDDRAVDTVRPSRSTGRGGGADGMDSETIARAIQTALKRDQG